MSRELTDTILEKAIQTIEQSGVERALIIDRLLTWAGSLSTLEYGTAHTAEQFEAAAGRIRNGLLAKLEAEMH